MTNSNCLEGIGCPKCGSEESFKIDVSCTMDVTDDGTGDYSGVEWEDESGIRCDKCGHYGTVKDFKK